MASVKTDRVRAWRESVNPSPPEVNGASFVVARVALLTMAAFGIYYGFQSISFADGQAWSDKELTARSAAPRTTWTAKSPMPAPAKAFPRPSTAHTPGRSRMK
ncbi:hypothetical protein [Streptomyces tricolor]|uniref:hypothetical protein n=1 Tax=Streptomyces tricolor TaxID=68277 RepID=UPI0036E04AE8